MRLIDADRLRAKITAMVTRPLQFMYEIERAPTVEAIPKEWIRDYMLRLSDGSEAYECILVMLEEWEKENDK